jgi:hypothetical protein
MRKVEEFCGGVNEGETKGDEGVDGTGDYCVDEELVKHSLSVRFLIAYLPFHNLFYNLSCTKKSLTLHHINLL